MYGWSTAHLLLTRHLTAAVSQGQPLGSIDSSLTLDVVLAAQRDELEHLTEGEEQSGTSSPTQTDTHAVECGNYDDSEDPKDLDRPTDSHDMYGDDQMEQ